MSAPLSSPSAPARCPLRAVAVVPGPGSGRGGGAPDSPMANVTRRPELAPHLVPLSLAPHLPAGTASGLGWGHLCSRGCLPVRLGLESQAMATPPTPGGPAAPPGFPPSPAGRCSEPRGVPLAQVTQCPRGHPHALPSGSSALSWGPPSPAHTSPVTASSSIPPPEAGATTDLQTSPAAPHLPPGPPCPPGSHPAALPPAGPPSAVAPVGLCAHLVS